MWIQEELTVKRCNSYEWTLGVMQTDAANGVIVMSLDIHGLQGSRCQCPVLVYCTVPC